MTEEKKSSTTHSQHKSERYEFPSIVQHLWKPHAIACVLWFILPFIVGSAMLYFLRVALICALLWKTMLVIASHFGFATSKVTPGIADSYLQSKKSATLQERLDDGIDMSITYYDIVTDWYELAWGQSFQLGGAQGFKGESLSERCRRHEYWLAARAGMHQDQKWLDLGCGVGGPMRHLARFTGASIKGINLNMLQLQRAKDYISKEGLQEFCSLLYCDFAKLEEKLPLNAFDGAYALEAVCHAPDKMACFKSVFSVLKPGGYYCCYEWVLTDKFDGSDAMHRYCKNAVETLGGVPELITQMELIQCLKSAGFNVIECVDISNDLKKRYPDPWYTKFDPASSIFNFPASKFGIILLQQFLRISELLRIVPKGSAAAHKVITSGIDGTIQSGRLGIFTPHLFVKAQKPY
ncbi:putative Cycloartenol-C-24-methyltransferase [Cardiosporidium cionae]|uniref:Methyltransferase n=1 Tax=Cardiosporidium cionae TaxID=476202 RepID=A0ABQ7JFY4_9APIC|nr:putative Cycloartenol-C-24-methyltransferase [Cardiosporidium cionae]|eukprot:KAF8822931.1 putative Cycloartenol-C-24-methyltransferase [Cardiosporidium cionae]